MRWYRFGTDFFVCDCEKRKMYWMYIEFFGKKQVGKYVPKMCHRINQRFPRYALYHTYPAKETEKCFVLSNSMTKKIVAQPVLP